MKSETYAQTEVQDTQIGEAGWWLNRGDSGYCIIFVADDGRIKQ